VFVGWRWGSSKFLSALEGTGDARFPMPGSGVVIFLIKFVCPLAVLGTLVYIIATGSYF